MAWNDNLDANSVAYAIAADHSRFIRVVAGPGTGKSFALKRRVARLLESGVEPARILPVTFTKVAAEDLQRELIGMNVPRCEEIRGSTLHFPWDAHTQPPECACFYWPSGAALEPL